MSATTLAKDIWNLQLLEQSKKLTHNCKGLYNEAPFSHIQFIIYMGQISH